jgi:hypothetical protein
MIAASLRRHPQHTTPQGPWSVAYAIIPENGQRIGPRNFGKLSAPSLEDALPALAEHVSTKEALCLGLYRPHVQIEALPPGNAPPREVMRALQTRAETLHFDKRDDVRFLHAVKPDGTKCDAIAAMQDRYQKALTNGPFKLERISYIAYGWAHIADDIKVILDATQADNGWVELTMLSAPLAHTGQFVLDDDLHDNLEDQISEAVRTKYFSAPPEHIYTIDPRQALPFPMVAGSKLTPYKAALPDTLVEYLPLLGLARYRI